jgi:hypothetical protein
MMLKSSPGLMEKKDLYIYFKVELSLLGDLREDVFESCGVDAGGGFLNLGGELFFLLGPPRPRPSARPSSSPPRLL